MKRIIPLVTLLSTVCILLCFFDHAQGSLAPLDASFSTPDLLRRQETADSSSGRTDTSAMTSPDGSSGSSPDSTIVSPSSSPPPPETATSTDTESHPSPPASSPTPTEHTSAIPPQTTSHQSTPTTAIPVASTTPHATEHTDHSSSQAQKTASSANDTPSVTAPPTSLDSIASFSSSAPVESAVTSVSPTLVLGDMECSSDPLAQQDGRCPANHYCNAALKKCAVKLNNGMTCAADFQCVSGYCIGTCANRTTPNNTQGLSGGQIAGITLGTIGGGLVALVGLLFCYRRRKRRMAAQQSRAMHYMMDGTDTEMRDNQHGKAGTRLSKYNFLAQMLDGQQQSRLESSQQALNNDTHSILDYQNEYYVSKASLDHHPSALFNTHSVSSSITALRPRPITDDFNNETSAYNLSPKPRPDSEALSMEQRYPMQQHNSLVRATNRDSMTDTALPMSHRFTEQQQQHFMDINILWDDALHQSATPTSYQHQFQPSASLPPASQDAWSHEDQTSLPSTAPTTPRFGHPTGTAPPPLPSGPLSSSTHSPFF